MYDNCGHDHCNRLKSEITTSPTDGSDSSSDLALWLWEVHNSVNARLMKESAQRQNREVTHEELVASRFPTKKMCQGCWLDANMTKWDNKEVFRFLDEWFWPSNELTDSNFKAEGYLDVDRDIVYSSNSRGLKAPPFRQPGNGKGFAALFFLLLGFALLVISSIQKKLHDGRKKFVDSRYVKKKQSCLR